MTRDEIEAALASARERLQKAQAKGNARRVEVFQQEIKTLEELLAKAEPRAATARGPRAGRAFSGRRS